MNTNQNRMINDLIKVENSLGNPYILINNVSYPCVPSPDTYQWKLGNGGYDTINTLQLTIRMYNADGSYVFPSNVIPSPQSLLTYNGNVYRVNSVIQNVLRVAFEIHAVNSTSGI